MPGEASGFSIDEATRSYRLALTRGAITQRLLVSTGTHRVTQSRITGADTYAIDADEVTSYGAAELPKHLVLDALTAKTKVELFYRDITVNETPEVTLFEIEPPENVPVVEVQADGREVGP